MPGGPTSNRCVTGIDRIVTRRKGRGTPAFAKATAGKRDKGLGTRDKWVWGVGCGNWDVEFRIMKHFFALSEQSVNKNGNWIRTDFYRMCSRGFLFERGGRNCSSSSVIIVLPLINHEIPNATRVTDSSQNIG